jgi:hypothetical protein
MRLWRALKGTGCGYCVTASTSCLRAHRGAYRVAGRCGARVAGRCGAPRGSRRTAAGRGASAEAATASLSRSSRQALGSRRIPDSSLPRRRRHTGRGCERARGRPDRNQKEGSYRRRPAARSDAPIRLSVRRLRGAGGARDYLATPTFVSGPQGYGQRALSAARSRIASRTGRSPDRFFRSCGSGEAADLLDDSNVPAQIFGR